MRIQIRRPIAAVPYAVIYRPGTDPGQRPVYDAGTVTFRPGAPISLLGGSFDVLRGGFGDRGEFRISHPLVFAHGDWLEVYLEPSQDAPDYTGELLGEPWKIGPGTLQTRNLYERLATARWSGWARGGLPQFLGGVLQRATLPAGIRIAALPEIPGASFEANVSSELLGDTIASILPALGGRLVGVDASGAVVCVDPEGPSALRFPDGAAETPPGSTENYANCVRFSFEYPSGDTGWFEGVDAAAVRAIDGEAWTVTAAAARELGQAEEPLAYASVKTTRGYIVPARRIITPATTRTTVLSGNPPVTVYVPPVIQTVPFPLDVTTSAALVNALATESSARPKLSYAAEEPATAYVAGGLYYGLGYVSPVQTNLLGLEKQVANRVQFYDEPIPRTLAEEIASYAVVDLLIKCDRGRSGGNPISVKRPPRQQLALYYNGTDGSATLSNGALRSYPAGSDTPAANWDTWETVVATPDWVEWGPRQPQGTYRITVPLGVADRMTSLRYDVGAVPMPPDPELAPLSIVNGGRVRINLPANAGQGAPRRSYLFEVGPNADYVPALGVHVLSPAASSPQPPGYPAAAAPVTWFPYSPVSGESASSVSPLDILGAEIKSERAIRLDFDNFVTLPFGSSVELKVVGAGGAEAVWLLPGGESQFALDKAYAGQYSVSMAAAAETRARLNSGSYRVLAPAGTARDGWLRFAVRAPDGYLGSGTPPAASGQTLLILGAQNINQVRVMQPALGNLAGYASQLLRYRVLPVREWTGHLSGLRRWPAVGQATFELTRTAATGARSSEDVTLDIQRVTYNLDTDSTRVVAGTPKPRSDAAAIAGAIQGVQRTVRRATQEKT